MPCLCRRTDARVSRLCPLPPSRRGPSAHSRRSVGPRRVRPLSPASFQGGTDDHPRPHTVFRACRGGGMLRLQAQGWCDPAVPGPPVFAPPPPPLRTVARLPRPHRGHRPGHTQLHSHVQAPLPTPKVQPSTCLRPPQEAAGQHGARPAAHRHDAAAGKGQAHHLEAGCRAGQSGDARPCERSHLRRGVGHVRGAGRREEARGLANPLHALHLRIRRCFTAQRLTSFSSRPRHRPTHFWSEHAPSASEPACPRVHRVPARPRPRRHRPAHRVCIGRLAVGLAPQRLICAGPLGRTWWHHPRQQRSASDAATAPGLHGALYRS
mmetsp:Transcript_18104/g.43284  ORF Transcript_18104/g.43284 Transcript_18104/m.43284 type:complete len:322 (+) Transcript_18104:138-1103(+)